jgi:hypothetical protein
MTLDEVLLLSVLLGIVLAIVALCIEIYGLWKR